MELLKFMIVLLPVFVSLAFILRNMIGPYVPPYRSLLFSLIKELLMFRGNIEVNTILSYNTTMGVVYFVLILIFEIYLLYSAINSIIISTYQ